jgi:hypothetical protein
LLSDQLEQRLALMIEWHMSRSGCRYLRAGSRSPNTVQRNFKSA